MKTLNTTTPTYTLPSSTEPPPSEPRAYGMALSAAFQTRTLHLEPLAHHERPRLNVIQRSYIDFFAKKELMATSPHDTAGLFPLEE